MELIPEITAEIKRETDPIYAKVSKVIPQIEWAFHAPLIHKINMLKKEKNAVVLAHNYQTPEIFHGIADIAADSLALAVEAEKTNAEVPLINQKQTTEYGQTLTTSLTGAPSATSVLGKQINLYGEQAKGFKWNADQKYLKTLLDSWAINISTAGVASTQVEALNAAGVGTDLNDHIDNAKPTG